MTSLSRFIVCVMLALAVGLPLTARAKLEELWRFPLSEFGVSPLTSMPLTAASADVYFAADDTGTVFAVSTSGKLLWSLPNGEFGNTTLVDIIASPRVADVVIVAYTKPGWFETLMTFVAVDAQLGTPLWNATHGIGFYPPHYALDEHRNAFVTALAVFVYSYDLNSYGLRDGALLWSQNNSTSSYALVLVTSLLVTESVIAVEGGFPLPDTCSTFSPTTGAPLCNFPTTSSTTLGGNVFFSQPTLSTNALFDTTSCALLVNLTELGLTMQLQAYGTPSHMFVLGAQSQYVFFAAYGQDDGQQWNRTVLAARPSAVNESAVAGVDGETLYLIWGGTAVAANISTGKLLWHSKHALPTAPNPIPVIPMGHRRALVLNLQGYVLLDTHAESIIAVNTHQPLTNPLWHRRSDGTAVVIVAELGTGDVVALQDS